MCWSSSVAKAWHHMSCIVGNKENVLIIKGFIWLKSGCQQSQRLPSNWPLTSPTMWSVLHFFFLLSQKLPNLSNSLSAAPPNTCSLFTKIKISLLRHLALLSMFYKKTHLWPHPTLFKGKHALILLHLSDLFVHSNQRTRSKERTRVSAEPPFFERLMFEQWLTLPCVDVSGTDGVKEWGNTFFKSSLTIFYVEVYVSCLEAGLYPTHCHVLNLLLSLERRFYWSADISGIVLLYYVVVISVLQRSGQWLLQAWCCSDQSSVTSGSTCLVP